MRCTTCIRSSAPGEWASALKWIPSTAPIYSSTSAALTLQVSLVAAIYSIYSLPTNCFLLLCISIVMYLITPILIINTVHSCCSDAVLIETFLCATKQFEPIKIPVRHKCAVFVQINYSFEPPVPQAHLSFQDVPVALAERHFNVSLLKDIKYFFSFTS